MSYGGKRLGMCTDLFTIESDFGIWYFPGYYLRYYQWDLCPLEI